MKRLWNPLLLFMLALLTACASMGIPPADTFNKRLATGYATVQAVADSAMALHHSGRLTREEAADVGRQLNGAVGALDAAAIMFRTDPVAAENRLAVTITALTALQAFLAQKEKS